MQNTGTVNAWLQKSAEWREVNTPDAMAAYYVSITYQRYMKDERLTQEQRDEAGWKWLTSMQWLERCIKERK